MFRDKFNRSGFTIMELLVTAAIVAVVVHFAGRITFDSYLGINKLDNSSLRTEAAKYLMETVDCTKSFVATGSQRTCKTAGPKVLKDKGGNTIVANTAAGTKYGQVTLKAECNGANDGLIIKARYLTSSGNLTSTSPASFMPDPLTGQRQTWADPQSLLLPGGVTLCPVFDSTPQASDYILLENVQPWGTEGGYCSPVKTWITIPLNTITDDTSSTVVIIAGNSFSLDSGTYECILAPTLSYTNESRARLYNVTAGVTQAYSQSMMISVASPPVTIRTKFTIAAPTTFKLQVWCAGAGLSDALGINAKTYDTTGAKVPETFAQAECFKYDN